MNQRFETIWPWRRVGAPALRFLLNLPNFVRLYWRLVCDRRVSLWPKALLLLGILYALSPVDFIPDVIPFVGEIDDLVIVIVALRLFIHLCPREVVREHVHRIDTGG